MIRTMSLGLAVALTLAAPVIAATPVTETNSASIAASLTAMAAKMVAESGGAGSPGATAQSIQGLAGGTPVQVTCSNCSGGGGGGGNAAAGATGSAPPSYASYTGYYDGTNLVGVGPSTPFPTLDANSAASKADLDALNASSGTNVGGFEIYQPVPVSIGAIATTAAYQPIGPNVTTGAATQDIWVFPILRSASRGGALTKIAVYSQGGFAGHYLMRFYSAEPNPSHCAQAAPFNAQPSDIQFLINTPMDIAMSAIGTVGVGVGESGATYGEITFNPGLSFTNQDTGGSGAVNIYACVVPTTADSADVSKVLQITVAGKQD